jgi:hypothetical protein
VLTDLMVRGSEETEGVDEGVHKGLEGVDEGVLPALNEDVSTPR